MDIIISKNGKNANMVSSTGFEREDYLQEYIYENPDAIPLYEIEKDRKLFIVKREFPTNSGPIDALAIDDRGNIYIIETKLYKNPDKRHIVAQALDYGAALWKHFNDFERFLDIARRDIVDKFQMSFEQKIREFFDINDQQVEDITTSMKNNLDDGSIKFIILMDTIDERLKDLILYVNTNSRFDIYAVQFKYYKYEEYEIIIPKTYGIEVRKEIPQKSFGSRIRWNQEGYTRELLKLSPNLKEKVENLMNFSLQEGCLDDWGTGRVPAFYFKIPDPHNEGRKITVFSVWSDGYIQVAYWLKDLYKKNPVIIGSFIDEVNKIEGMVVAEQQKRYDRLPLDNISDTALDKFKRLVISLKNDLE